MRHPSTPLFDERYINYGYNKMEHMDKIRAQGIDTHFASSTRLQVLSRNPCLRHGHGPSGVGLRGVLQQEEESDD